MDRQPLRDWVIRFNDQGPDGLINIPSPGLRTLTAIGPGRSAIDAIRTARSGAGKLRICRAGAAFLAT